MAKVRDWQGMRAMFERLLEERTGTGVATWNLRIKKERLDDEKQHHCRKDETRLGHSHLLS